MQITIVNCTVDFMIPLQNHQRLCFTFETEKDLIINLLRTPRISVDGLFTQDPNQKNAEQLSSISITVEQLRYKESNTSISIAFTAADASIWLEQEQIKVFNVQSLHVEQSCIRIVMQDEMEKWQESHGSHEQLFSVTFAVRKSGLIFDIVYHLDSLNMDRNHLSIDYRRLPTLHGHKTCCSLKNGLVGQFFNAHIKTEAAANQGWLVFVNTNREPTPVSYNSTCWTASSSKNSSLIQGTYLDYISP